MPAASMDDILASIRKIIADEDQAPAGDHAEEAEPEEGLSFVDESGAVSTAPPPVRPAEAPLELTPKMQRPAGPADSLLSTAAADASRQALSQLSGLIVSGGKDNTLEGLVREMLRPMLKAWLDERLPAIVEAAVAREVARIAGEGL
jgi:cell pole-organizing protein PopZ